MAATAAVTATAYFLSGKQKGPVGKALTAAKNFVSPPAPTITPPALPPPPSTQHLVQDQAAAMTAAAQRYRMMQPSGYGATIKTSPSGAGPAPTARKVLLGQ